MKKNLFRAFMAAVAICSAVCMTSCSKDDDGEQKPNNEQQQESDLIKTVPTYTVGLSETVLDYYDVTITVANGTKTKEVVLTKSNGKVGVCEHIAERTTLYTYRFGDDVIEGGVKSATATVLPKADIETLLKKLDPEQEVPMEETTYLGSTWYYKNGTVSDMNGLSDSHVFYETAGDLLSEKAGVLEYISMAESLQKLLTRK